MTFSGYLANVLDNLFSNLLFILISFSDQLIYTRESRSVSRQNTRKKNYNMLSSHNNTRKKCVTLSANKISTDIYSGLPQTSKMENLITIVNSEEPFNIIA